MKKRWSIGVDEVGRGPLAGPVAVGMVKVSTDFDWSLVSGVDDSKKLSPENRSAIFRRAEELRHLRKLDFTVSQVGPSIIDSYGIMFAIKLALQRCICRLKLDPQTVSFRLDGSLSAPVQFEQATIIGGDGLWPEISLASIVAKVTRDKYMERISKRYSRYGFAEHKGYGTRDHRAAIAKYGKSPVHRVSFCKNILN